MILFDGKRIIRISVQCRELFANLRVARKIIHILLSKVDD